MKVDGKKKKLIIKVLITALIVCISVAGLSVYSEYIKSSRAKAQPLLKAVFRAKMRV